MEPTFYEESVNSFYCSPNNRIGVNNVMTIGAKRPNGLSLDLNVGRQNGLLNKRPKMAMPPNSLPLTPLLNSPELMKLGTPEFEKLLSISNADGTVVTTTASMQTPTSNQMYFEKVVTEEQENYVRGFVEALNDLRHSDSSQEPGGNQGATYTNLEPPGSVQSTESILSQSMVQIKDEPHTVPSVSSSPPMSPIDMESQEKIKLERKRQRNRVAASKCRRRKLERISRLEDKVKLLKNENNDLSQVVNRLREQVSKLKEQVIDHVQVGCQIQSINGLY